MRKIAITSPSRYPVNRKDLRKRIMALMAKNGIKDDYYIHIILVGDRKMAKLNQKYMKHAGTTDVLSFPLLFLSGGKTPQQDEWPVLRENILELGEIVISYPQAKRQAIRKNKTLDDETIFLAEHGTKHLLGFHHE